MSSIASSKDTEGPLSLIGTETLSIIHLLYQVRFIVNPYSSLSPLGLDAPCVADTYVCIRRACG